MKMTWHHTPQRTTYTEVDGTLGYLYRSEISEVSSAPPTITRAVVYYFSPEDDYVYFEDAWYTQTPLWSEPHVRHDPGVWLMLATAFIDGTDYEDDD